MASYSMTFLQMQTELSSARYLNDTGNTAWSADNKKDELNRAVNELMLLWNDVADINVKDLVGSTGSAITTSAGAAEYNLPADFLLTKKGWVYILSGIGGQTYRELLPMDYEEMYIRDASSQNECPTNYCIVGSYSKITVGVTQTETFPKLRLFPTPDGAYVIGGKYIPVSLDVLSADSDIAPIPGNFHDLVVLKAAINLAKGPAWLDILKTWDVVRRDRMKDFEEFIRSRSRPRDTEIHDMFYRGE